MAGKIEAVAASNPDSRILSRAAELVLAGEVLVCPTDTGYAFSANALDPEAIARVFALKGRRKLLPFFVISEDLQVFNKQSYRCSCSAENRA